MFVLAWMSLACAPWSMGPLPPDDAVPSKDAIGSDEAITAVRAFLATRPAHEHPLDPGIVLPPGLSSWSAKDCGTCHADHYAQWRVSTHAAAWTDRQFQAERLKSDDRWVCNQCHTPLLQQQQQWAVGLTGDDIEKPTLIEGVLFDAALRDEGITCAACHVVDGRIVGPRDTPDAPHGGTKDARFTSEGLCVQCHQAEAAYPGKPFACTFGTGDEWQQGPYPAEGRDCRSCHMPGGKHWWRGAGIPKEPGGGPPPEANPPGLGLTATWERLGSEPSGGTVRVVATNANAGHRLPTGDPERFVQIAVSFADAAGAPVGQAFTARIGQTWEWYPEARKLDDNRLAPRESRTYDVPAPPGAIAATVEASSHRITAANVAYHQLGDYPASIVTHTIAVPAP